PLIVSQTPVALLPGLYHIVLNQYLCRRRTHAAGRASGIPSLQNHQREGEQQEFPPKLLTAFQLCSLNLRRMKGPARERRRFRANRRAECLELFGGDWRCAALGRVEVYRQ